jgi:hypothetical protein
MVEVLSSQQPVAMNTPEKKVHSRKSFMSWLFGDTEPEPEPVKKPYSSFTRAAIVVGAFIAVAIAFVFIVPYMFIRTALMIPG